MRAGTETLRRRFTWRRFQGKRFIGFLCSSITSLPAASDPDRHNHSRTQVAASWRQRWSVTPIKYEMSVDQDPISAPPQTTICSVGARLLRPGGAEAELLHPGLFLVHLVLPSHHRKVGFLRAHSFAESAECIVCTALVTAEPSLQQSTTTAANLSEPRLT